MTAVANRHIGQQPGIDVLAIVYTFYVFTPDDPRFVPLTPSSLTWEEQTGEFSMRVTATFPNVQTPSGWVHQLVALAGQAFLFADWGNGPTEVFRGKIWHWTFTDSGHEEVQVICYDRLMYLQKSKDSKSYNLGADPMGVALPVPDPSLRAMPINTAGQIMDDLARRWGFSVAGTDLLTRTMPAMVWTATALSQMFVELLDRTYWLGAGSFVLRSDHDTISILPPATNRPIYLLTTDQLSQYSDQQSMEDLVTRVVVQGFLPGGTAGADPVADPNNYLLPIAGILDGDTQFGVMQDIIQLPAQISQYDLIQIAKQTIMNRGQLSRIQKFDAPDLPFLRRGDVIAVTAGTLNGLYIITGIQHDMAARRMQITIDTSGDLTDPSVNFRIEESAIDPRVFNPGGGLTTPSGTAPGVDALGYVTGHERPGGLGT